MGSSMLRRCCGGVALVMLIRRNKLHQQQQHQAPMRLLALSLPHTPLADHGAGCVCAMLCLAQRSMQQHSLMVTSPSGLCSILSMPLGPREERSVRATVFAARMFALTASVPRSRDLLPCSCTTKKCMERCCCRRHTWLLGLEASGALIVDHGFRFVSGGARGGRKTHPDDDERSAILIKR